jgi:ubiquinone/menaquinone biosynthesis C-methylase UbiE
MQEFARVLKPGGLLVITDSSQLGDRPQMNANMDNFTSLNEPHFASYIRFDFGAAFKEVGLEPDLKCMQSATKSLSAIKPRV